MKIAVILKSGSFSERWCETLSEWDIPFDSFELNYHRLLEKLLGYDVVLWHWGPEESSFAHAWIHTLEGRGVKIFPSVATSWHFDNKVWQHYLFKSTSIPVVPTWVFHSKISALNWATESEYPVVFKLSGGASSTNVILVHSRRKAKQLIRQAFGRGFKPVNRWSLLMNQVWKFKRDHTIKALLGIVNGIRLLFVGKPIEKLKPNEKGSVYFQKFVPQNDFDTRVIVIGDRCIAVRRYNRPNDFRASGSGVVDYRPEIFDTRLFELSFDLASQLNMQSMACDYVFSESGDPLLIEISYGFITGEFYESCRGYWDRDLNWHDKLVRPERFILEDLLGKSDLFSNAKGAISSKQVKNKDPDRS